MLWKCKVNKIDSEGFIFLWYRYFSYANKNFCTLLNIIKLFWGSINCKNHFDIIKILFRFGLQCILIG